VDEVEVSSSVKVYRSRLRNAIRDVPWETKQRILDLLWDGKTVGEIIKIVDIELLVVSGIIVDNIGTVKYLRRKPK